LLRSDIDVTPEIPAAVYGTPAPDVVAIPAGAVQMSPQSPGGRALEDVPPASLSGMVMAAPPGTLERRYALALSLRALRPGAPLLALAPKAKGGNRIAKELEAFGCDVAETSRRHQRVCETNRPATFDPGAEVLIDEAIRAGGPRFVDELGFWTQPGIFSWDRLDPGTALLLSVLPALAGRGADLGCGIGVIARAVLANAGVTEIDLVDIDRRAIAAAKQNVVDPRARFHWADVRSLADVKALDFVVMNPPFHDGGREDRALGETFVRQSHRMLRDGGTAWLVANLHLPYESVMAAAFSQVSLRAEQGGFKVYEATK
jgi:16S rRNA (guanine1207-N2)-methyltransferase